MARAANAHPLQQGGGPVPVLATRVCDPILDVVLASGSLRDGDEGIPLQAWLGILQDPGMRHRLSRIESLAFQVALMPMEFESSMAVRSLGATHRTFRVQRSHEGLMGDSIDVDCTARIGSLRLGAAIPQLILPSVAADADRLLPEEIRRLPVGAVLNGEEVVERGCIGTICIENEEEI